MAGTHGKSAAIWKDGYNLSGQSSNITLTAETAAEDVTSFGDTWGNFNCIGIKSFTMGITSFFNESSTAIPSGQDTNAIYQAGFGGSAIWSWWPTGTATVGNYGYGVSGALQVNDPITTPVAGAIVSDISVTGTGTLEHLRCLGASTSTSTNASAAFTSLDCTAACTTSTLAAYAHVSSISGTAPSLAIVIQESSDNNTWADLITMAAIAASGATGAVRTTLSSSTARYNRAKYTPNASTTSVTFICGLARPW